MKSLRLTTWISVLTLFVIVGQARSDEAAPVFQVPAIRPLRKDAKQPDYVETKAKIPYYLPGEKWGTTGEPIHRMPLPLDADDSIQHIVTPVGFHVQLFAAEPDIVKPLAMNWDARGRLWIAESVDYPNERQEQGQGRDRIKICEDSDGDGRADKFTVFADKLSIPTSLIFSHGGVVVHQAPQTLFLMDTDGDDRADVRQVLLEGWNTNDTHAGPSNLRYGLDNWIWGVQGYAGFQGNVGGKKHQFRQGISRFRFPRPAASGRLDSDYVELEFVRSTDNNTWGLGLSEEGIVFASTANRNPSVVMPIANRYYERVRGWSAERLPAIAHSHLFQPVTQTVRQVDHHGGYTAAAGHALYTARNYPQPYWNRTAFVCGPTGHLVGTFLLNRDGSNFRSNYLFNLLASDDEWTAPIMAEVGPDGNVWVIDWYNYIVQHNPTPAGFKTGKGNAYETELRDKQHGRVYRIVYDGDVADARQNQSPVAGSPAANVPTTARGPFTEKETGNLDLTTATPAQLVETLRHNNMFWRLHAQRLLVERAKTDVLPQLVALANDTRVDPIGLNVAAIHALWTIDGLGLLEGDHREAIAVVMAALRHPSAGVRRSAVMVLPNRVEAVEAILNAELLSDAAPQVRLAALLKLSDVPAERRAAAALADSLRQIKSEPDRWLHDAATAAAATHVEPFLDSVAGGKDHPPALLQTARIVAEHYARQPPQDSIRQLLGALHDADPPAAEAIVAGLAAGWPKGHDVALPPVERESIVVLLSRLSLAGKTDLIRLTRRWGVDGFQEHARETTTALMQQAKDEGRSDPDRTAAARRIIALNESESDAAERLLDLITPRTSSELASGWLNALTASRAGSVGPATVQRMTGWTPTVQTAAVRMLLSRSQWTRALLDGMERGRLHLADLTLEQKRSLAEHPSRMLRERANKLFAQLGELTDANRQQVVARLLPLAEQPGDTAIGKRVFTKHCAACHRYQNEGTKIGPDLSGMAAHSKAELLTQILDPSRSVEGNYRVYQVVTVHGRVLSGLLASETKTSVELFDAQGKKHIVLRDDIERLVSSPKSLMPEGFENELKPEEIAGLLELLTPRGKKRPTEN